ncbi:hypothetical protein FGO68_gene8104 [Halteria grandinella]|uniref:TLDc domain-containing protein n=1 Tax=Halteria grandinella TaxID=5974 RepID=A0A8J8N8Z6_HALGN|nr:hypothetical protein FGO68_gene8104 [Halteria grandinella]
MKLSVDEYSNYIPNQGTKSTIVSYEQFSKIWMMLPEHVRIRNAELIYSAHTEGFNLQSLYNICSEYKYDYKFSLLLIQTKKNQIFGAFIDDVIRLHIRGYLGSQDCFVFTVQPNVRVFYETGQNMRYLLGEMTYFQIGGEGDGPAIWVNERLERGHSNKSATFGNEILTLGQRHIDDTFDIHNLEVFIL